MSTLRYYKKGVVAFVTTLIAGLTWALTEGNGITGLEALGILGMLVPIVGGVTVAENGPKPPPNPLDGHRV